MNKTQREGTSYRATQGIVNGNSFGLKSYGEEGKFRSKYEHAFAVYLKELGVKYEFEKHGEPIVNITNTNLHYIPDFYLPEYNIYVEIVNEMNRRMKMKMYLFKQQNDTELVVLDKQHLREMFNSKFTFYELMTRLGIKKVKNKKEK